MSEYLTYGFCENDLILCKENYAAYGNCEKGKRYKIVKLSRYTKKYKMAYKIGEVEKQHKGTIITLDNGEVFNTKNLMKYFYSKTEIRDKNLKDLNI